MAITMAMKRNAFATYAWSVLGYNVLVILWGAFVRATGSGAGCGSHWPLCNGEVVPRAPSAETLIEFSHRLTSGLLGLLVLGLLVWAFRAYGRGHAVRKAAIWTMVFVMTEAIIGAGLVKFEWVAANASIERVYTMAFHLINTFFLLAANTLTAWFASGGRPFSLRNQGAVGLSLGLALVGMLILGASGAVTALGDTLFLRAGLTPEESPLLAWLIRVRIYHPLLAVGVFALIGWAVAVVTKQRPGGLTGPLALAVLALYVVQLLGGALNVYLRAPVWMQLLHLLLSDAIWIALILLAASTLAQKEKAEQPSRTQPSATLEPHGTA